MPVKYNIIDARDLKQERAAQFSYKLDRRQPIRAVITDEFGNDSGSGDIWYDQSKRRVWIRELGTSSASIVSCYTLTPVIGLGVLVGWRPYSITREVLSSDIEFLGQTNATGTSYESPSNLDFLPGGRLQLWLQSKLLQPLATYPSTSGLVVNVVGGDYIYNGQRVTFTGQTNIDLSASQPTAGNYVFVGLYLDSSNTLQTVTGASGASTPPAEPTWPDGAFRLSVVRLYNPQTKINLKLDTDADNDIFDRRMLWVDVDSFDIWPYDKIITVSPTNAFAKYSTIQDANDNETGPVIVLLDGGAYSETPILSSGSIGYASLGTRSEVAISSAGAVTVNITGAGIALRNLTISNTNAGATATGIRTIEDNTILNNVRILKTSGAATTSIGLHVTGGGDSGVTLTDGSILVAAGTTQYGILIDTDTAFLTINGGEITGTTADIRVNHANAFVYLNGPKLLGGGISIAAGTVEGWYRDADNNVIICAGNYFYGNISGTGRPNSIVNADFLDWPRGTTITSPATGDYTATLWQYGKVGAMVHTVSQSTDVPTVAQAGILVPYSALIDCTTLDSSIAAGDFCTFSNGIEGYNFLDLAQREFTFSFWVKASKIGVYCVAFRNSNGDRSYVAEYTINTTATWEFKTVTVTASPSAGTWLYTTGLGLFVSFTLAGGSTFQTTPGAWQTGNFFSTANQVNGCDSASNNFRLALPRIAPGPVAPSPRIPDIEAELLRCQRYCQGFDYAGYGGTFLSASTVIMYMTLKTEMRTQPTITLLDTTPQLVQITTAGALSGKNGSGSTVTAVSASEESFNVQLDGFTGCTAGSFASVSGAQRGTDWILASAEF